MTPEYEGSSVSEGLEYKGESGSIPNNPHCIRIQELRQKVEVINNYFPNRNMDENRLKDIFLRCDEFCRNYTVENLVFVLLTDKDRYISEFEILEEDLLAVISEIDQLSGDSLRQSKQSNNTHEVIRYSIISSERKHLEEKFGINPLPPGSSFHRQTVQRSFIYGPQFSAARQHYKVLIERNTATQRSFNLNPDIIEIDFGKLLGTGGFANVYAGYYHLTEEKSTPVAIKLLKKRENEKEHHQEQNFFKEIGFQQALMGHSNILWYYGWTRLQTLEGEFQLTLVTELNDQSLKQWIETTTSSDTAAAMTILALHILHGIASGMKHLSASGILHCDLSVNNILMKGNEPRIADFGLVGSRSGGTSGYLAPEVYFSQRNKLSDVYSFGIIAFYILNRMSPWVYLGLTDYDGEYFDQIVVRGDSDHIVPYLEQDNNNNQEEEEEEDVGALQLIYQLLNSCRSANFELRPHFKIIEKELKRLGKVLLKSDKYACVAVPAVAAAASCAAESMIATNNFFASKDGDDVVYNMIRASHGISTANSFGRDNSNMSEPDDEIIKEEFDTMFSELIYSVEGSSFASTAPRQYAALLFESDKLLQLKGLEFLKRALERREKSVSDLIGQELALIPQIVALLRFDSHLINHAAMSLLADLAAASKTNIRLILLTDVLQKIEAAFVNDQDDDNDFLYLGDIARLLFFLCMEEISSDEKDFCHHQVVVCALVFCLCEKYPITIRDEFGQEELIQFLKNPKREEVVGNHVMESLLHLLQYVKKAMTKEALTVVSQLLRSYTKKSVQVVDPFFSNLTDMLSSVINKVSNGSHHCKYTIMFCSLCVKFLVQVPELVLNFDSLLPLEQKLSSLLAVQCESHLLDDTAVAFLLQAWREIELALTEVDCCPQRHRLQCTDSGEAMVMNLRVTCDQCQKKIILKQKGCFYSCRLCDYDVCSVCVLALLQSAAETNGTVVNTTSSRPPAVEAVAAAATSTAIAAPLPMDCL